MKTEKIYRMTRGFRDIGHSSMNVSDYLHCIYEDGVLKHSTTLELVDGCTAERLFGDAEIIDAFEEEYNKGVQ